MSASASSVLFAENYWAIALPEQPAPGFDGVYNVFLRIMQEQVGGEIPLPAAVESVREGTASAEESALAARWLALLDAAISPCRFRQALEHSNLDGREMQALVRHFARKNPLQQEDAERLEWLLTSLFRSRFACGDQIPPARMLEEIRAWLGGTPSKLPAAAEALLAELWEIRESIARCRSFQELTQSKLVDRGRSVKRRLRENLMHPEVLAAVVNYNLVSGRRFEQLLSEVLQDVKESPSDLATKDYRAAAEDFRLLVGSQTGGSPQEEKKVTSPASPMTAADFVLRIDALGVDPKWEESHVELRISELVSFAKAAGEPLSTIPLANSVLVLSPTEWQTLVSEYPPTEESFRAGLHRIVRRAVGVLAGIQEEMALYEVRRTGEYLWKKHLNSLFYLLYTGSKILPDLENLDQEAQRRGLQKKSEHLFDTAGRLRQSLQQVSELYQQWKEQSAQTLTAAEGRDTQSPATAQIRRAS